MLNKLSCEQIYKEYQTIQDLRDQCCLEWNALRALEGNDQKKKMEQVKDLVQSIKEKIEALREKVSLPEKMFFRFFYRPEVKEKLKEMISIDDLNPDEFFTLFGHLSGKTITTENYYNFLRIVNENTDELLEFTKGIDKEFAQREFKSFLQFFHSAFLNTFLKENTKIQIHKEIPEWALENFGCYLKQGTIDVASVKGGFGYDMRGGTVRVGIGGAEGETFCEEMEGGTVYAKKVSGTVGRWMDGGTIYIEESQNIGSRKNRGTILIGNPNTVEMEEEKHSRILWYYDETDGVYKNFRGGKEFLIHTFEELKGFKFQKEGVAVIQYPSLRDYPDLTKDLEGGIMVLRKMPSVIGKDMKGGIIIIEDDDPNITPEEVKKRISPDKTGGFVFVRLKVPGTENTYLHEVE